MIVRYIKRKGDEILAAPTRSVLIETTSFRSMKNVGDLTSKATQIVHN